MKKYTEKQIKSFKEMINNGIISQIGGEDWDLLKTIINNQSEKNKERLMEHLLKEYKEYFPLTEINRKSMIELLRLPFFATKEDILNELKEIL